MRRKIFNICIIIISLFVLSQLLIKKTIIYSSILYALNIWVNNLIPALFPFFIISDILINYNVTEYIPKIIKIICKSLFNISDNMLTIFILSMISGFPSNARNTRIFYDKGLITLKEANHILIFSHFSNPVFILTTVAIFFFNNQKVGIILLITHYLSNIILGICFRNKITISNSSGNYNNRNNDFGTIFISSIKKAVDTILLICGILTIFLMLSSIIINTFSFNSYNAMLIKGFFEITIGIEALSNLSISMLSKTVIASMFLAFGGISVHVQVLSQITETKIKYIYFFIGRMYQMIISGVLTYLICIIIKI
jgi:sporulation integral membrane protein YlbJ